MQNVNVFTYYTHKLAWEAGQRQLKQRAKAPRKSFSAPWKLALALALACTLAIWWSRFSLPALSVAEVPAQVICVVAAAAWGLMIGWVCQKFPQRLAKVNRALKGLPLAEDDVRLLKLSA